MYEYILQIYSRKIRLNNKYKVTMALNSEYPEYTVPKSKSINTLTDSFTE